MSITKRAVAASVGALGITAAAAAFFPATASAASYGNQCGDGYSVIDSHDVKGGTVFLTYNGEKNCAVTVRNDPGAAKHMAAALELSHGTNEMKYEEGDFTEFAGPVYLSAEGKCIDWGGVIGDNDNKFEEFNVHCGA